MCWESKDYLSCWLTSIFCFSSSSNTTLGNPGSLKDCQLGSCVVLSCSHVFNGIVSPIIISLVWLQGVWCDQWLLKHYHWRHSREPASWTRLLHQVPTGPVCLFEWTVCVWVCFILCSLISPSTQFFNSLLLFLSKKNLLWWGRCIMVMLTATASCLAPHYCCSNLSL